MPSISLSLTDYEFLRVRAHVLPLLETSGLGPSSVRYSAGQEIAVKLNGGQIGIVLPGEQEPVDVGDRGARPAFGLIPSVLQNKLCTLSGSLLIS